MYSQNNYDALPKHPTDWELIGSVGVARNAGYPMRYSCPYGQPGDRLWVRETWQALHKYNKTKTDDIPEYERHWVNYPADGNLWDARQRPSIHMPRWACRILLEIVSVRVERLRDITEADALAEGIERFMHGGREVYKDYLGRHYCCYDQRFSFNSLWKSINSLDSWDKNPWVWVIEFKRVNA